MSQTIQSKKTGREYLNTNEITTQERNAVNLGKLRRANLEYIQHQFDVKKTVDKLHEMMDSITKQDLNYANIDAACKCIQQLNSTINTSINAARFLNELAH